MSESAQTAVEVAGGSATDGTRSVPATKRPSALAEPVAPGIDYRTHSACRRTVQPPKPMPNPPNKGWPLWVAFAIPFCFGSLSALFVELVGAPRRFRPVDYPAVRRAAGHLLLGHHLFVGPAGPQGTYTAGCSNAPFREEEPVRSVHTFGQEQACYNPR